ncbi:MAG: geranylgeranylglycerol-phosphate geranylgeranyltransferase [Saprospiraceae bacterium]|nr:geranylgeranylglycerol-phosphate geranylgeranyltransferase [Saprospiraceae bacterium]
MFANFLKLIRLPNLLLIVFTHTIIRFGLIEPFYDRIGPGAPLDLISFYILSITVVLIAAGGYIINDIYDQEIDKLNRPDKRIVGNKLSIGLSWIFYATFTGTGLGLTFIFFSNWIYWVINLGAILALVLYAISLKKRGFIGNLLVALLCALVLIEVTYEDLSYLWHHSQILENTDAIFRFTLLMAYVLFAFLSTLARELTKDLEDQEGDRALDCKTLPVVWGAKSTKWVIVILSCLLLGVLGFELYLFVPFYNFMAITYIAVFLILPVLFLFYRLSKASEQEHYHQLSQHWKAYMFLGIFFLVIYDLNFF